jgi:hypothetical protein
MEIIKLCILLLLCAYARPSCAQVPGNWYSFYDAKNELYGFKDVNGKIKIPAKFNVLTHARTFRNIIAVTESKGNKSYYLLKNGQKTAKDSLYVWDMTYDCEQEGTIRFRDQVTDKVGFLSTDGKISVPAKFNDAGAFYNGLALVVYNGKRLCADGTPYKANACEHWSWEGTTAIINQSGTIVADSIDIAATEHLNWYSLKIVPHPLDKTLYTSFKGKNKKYYAFVNYEKEFKHWLYSEFLKQPEVSRLMLSCFDDVTVEGLFKHELRKNYSKSAFINQYGALMKSKMEAIKQRKFETEIIRENLNNQVYNSKSFKSFYTDCGEPNVARYPSFDVVTSHYNKQNQFDYQEHFSFLRTAGGYKLVGVALKNRK